MKLTEVQALPELRIQYHALPVVIHTLRCGQICRREEREDAEEELGKVKEGGQVSSLIRPPSFPLAFWHYGCWRDEMLLDAKLATRMSKIADRTSLLTGLPIRPIGRFMAIYTWYTHGG